MHFRFKVVGLIQTSVKITTLQQIINITWQHESYDIEKLSRWIRCLFNLALTSNDETAERLLDQVARIGEETWKARVFLESPILSLRLHWDSNPSFTQPRNSSGLQQRRSIMLSTYIARHMMPHVDVGQSEHWHCRIFAMMEADSKRLCS